MRITVCKCCFNRKIITAVYKTLTSDKKSKMPNRRRPVIRKGHIITGFANNTSVCHVASRSLDATPDSAKYVSKVYERRDQ